jgi:hypothetical protein
LIFLAIGMEWAQLPIAAPKLTLREAPDEMKLGDTLLIDRTNGAGMTVRYLLPRSQASDANVKM